MQQPAEDGQGYWGELPQQYLEKIFQVPFALPDLTPESAGRLLRSFLPDGGERADGSGPGPAGEVVSGESVEPRYKAPASLRLGRIDVEAGSAATAPSATHSGLDLTRDEIAFAERLAPLLGSPRSIKRLVNCYRMLRSTRYTGSASDFLDGHGYHAVLQLLAVSSSSAELGDAVAAALLAREHDDATWLEFVHRRRALPGWQSLYELVSALAGSGELLKDLDVYVDWAPRVARFSFSL